MNDIPDIPVRALGPGDDLEMMRSPDYWPLGPVLPLIMTSLEHSLTLPISEACGVLINKPGFSPSTVWKVNLMDGERLRKLLRGEDDHDVDSIEYPDVASVYEDGWRVG